MLVFDCPACGGKLQMPEKLAGKKVRCATCQEVITAPSGDSPTEGFTADPAPSKSANRTAVTAAPSSRRSTADDNGDADDQQRRGPRRDEPAKKGGMRTGAIVAVVAVLVVGCLVCGVGGTVMALMFPAILGVQNAAARTHTQNNMKQIALSAHNHHDMFGTLPTPKHLKPPQGTPVDLSWRVSILPFVEQQNLFNQFDQTTAWDSPRNAPFQNTIIPVYQHLGRDADKPNPATVFQYFTGPGTLWPDNSKRTMMSITDGTSNTFLFAEAAGAVPWSKPLDMAIQPGAAPPLPQERILVAMADGSVQLVDRRRVSDATLLLYINPTDGAIAPPLD